MARWLSQSLLLVSVVVVGVMSVVPQSCPTIVSTGCYYYDGKVAKLEPGNATFYVVGALFNIRSRGSNSFTCGTGFNPRGILHTQAFLFSLDYWRKQLKSTFIGVGGVVFDSCGRTEQMIQNVLGFEQCNIRMMNIDRHNLVGFVGPEDNAQAMAAAALTKDMDLTVISPAADSPLLSDKDMYTYFLRTSPSVSVDAEIMASILKGIKSKYVAVIYDEKDMSELVELKRQMSLAGICVTDSFGVSGMEVGTAFNNVVTKLLTAEQVRYVVFLADQSFGERLIAQVTQLGRDRKQPYNFVFLFPSSIQRTSSIFTVSNTAAENSILLERQDPAISEITTAVAAFKTYWSTLTAQTSKGSDPFLTEFLQAANSLPAYNVEAAYTIMATRAFVYGVYGAGKSECRTDVTGNYLCSAFDLGTGRGSMINEFIRTETRYFSNSTDLMRTIVPYNIYRYTDTFTNVGAYNGMQTTVNLANLDSFTPGQCQDNPCLKCNELPPPTTPKPTTTTTAAPSRCQPNTMGNYSVVYYPPNQEITGAYMRSPRNDSEYATRFEVGQKWIFALGVLAGLGILAVIVFEIYILYKLLGTSMGNKWRTMWLGQLLLFGIFLCYLTLFAYLPIPTKATCGITRFGVGVSYSICFAVLLVKLMVILTSKSSDNNLIPGDMESPNYLKGIYQFLMFVFVVGVQVVIDTQWLITVPPEAVKVMSNAGKEVWVCNHYTFVASTMEPSTSVYSMTNMASFVRNEFENHILSLVYIMFLILICTVLALNAHGIITNHRESVFIGIAAGFSIPIWLAWTLVGGLNRSHEYAHEFGDGCIAFGLFLTATLVLFSMFLPKVRQLVNMGVEGIYFEDDRDTYYAGSVIMAPPSYKSRPNSVIYVNNQGIYSEPVVLGNGDSGSNYMRQGYPSSVYSAPPATYVKRGADSTRGGSVLRVTDDLSGRRPLEKKRPQSELAYTTAGRPRSTHGTLPRSRSQSNLGAL